LFQSIDAQCNVDSHIVSVDPLAPQGFLDTPAIVARAAAYPGDQAYAYSAPPALKTVAAASSSSAATDEGSKVVSRRAQRDVAASAQHLMEEEVVFLLTCSTC